MVHSYNPCSTVEPVTLLILLPEKREFLLYNSAELTHNFNRNEVCMEVQLFSLECLKSLYFYIYNKNITPWHEPISSDDSILAKSTTPAESLRY